MKHPADRPPSTPCAVTTGEPRRRRQPCPAALGNPSEDQVRELQRRLDADADAALAYLLVHSEDWLKPGAPLPRLAPAGPRRAQP
ncbi:MAG: hypothetical protein M3378_02360 [Actinomycetota bacterium]|nr:hypothetical protein [Actinomycetota bacterium]MDQ3679386.1 hypothetical protein [Actinomycetota bacterium]